MRNNRWINFVPYLIVILALFSLMNMNTGTAAKKIQPKICNSRKPDRPDYFQ